MSNWSWLIIFLFAILINLTFTQNLEITTIDPFIRIKKDSRHNYDYIQMFEHFNLTLKCSNGANTSWNFPVEQNEGLNGFDLDDFKKRVTVREDEEGSTFHIRKLRPTDTGLYICEGETQTASVYVFVKGRYLLLRSNLYTINVDLPTFDIPCRSSFNSQFISLFVNDKKVDSSKRPMYDLRFGFRIDGKSSKQFEQYFDKIDNKGIQVRCEWLGEKVEFLLKVRENPNAPVLRIEPEVWTQNETESYSVTCTLLQGFPMDVEKNRLEIECYLCDIYMGPGSLPSMKQTLDEVSDNNRTMVLKADFRIRSGIYGFLEHKCSWFEKTANTWKLRNSTAFYLEWSKRNEQIQNMPAIRVQPHQYELAVRVGEPIVLRAELLLQNLSVHFSSIDWSGLDFNFEIGRVIAEEFEESGIDDKKITHNNNFLILEARVPEASREHSRIYGFRFIGPLLNPFIRWNVKVFREVNKRTIKISNNDGDRFRQFDRTYHKTNSTAKLTCTDRGHQISIAYQQNNTIHVIHNKPWTWDNREMWEVPLSFLYDTAVVCYPDSTPLFIDISSSYFMVADQKPETWMNVTKDPNAINEDLNKIYAGDDVEISCLVIEDERIDLSQMRLFHNNMKLIEEVERFSKGSSFILKAKIKNVTVGYSGHFACVTNDLTKRGTRINQTIEIEVNEVLAPVMNETEHVQESFKEGERREFGCKVKGSPQPHITWWKDGKLIQSGTSPHVSLGLTKMNMRDSGTYECIGKNRAGEAKRTMVLEVDDTSAVEKEKLFMERIRWIILLSILLLILLLVCLFVIHSRKQRIRAIAAMREKETALRRLYEKLMEGKTEEVNLYIPLDQQLDQLTYDPKFEIAEENLKIVTNPKLGSGQFGQVLKGFLKNPSKDSVLVSENRSLTVAVKMPKDGLDIQQTQMLIDELLIMNSILPHPNVLTLIGAITKNIPSGRLYVVIEMCDKGSLHAFLMELSTNLGKFKNELTKHLPAAEYLSRTQKQLPSSKQNVREKEHKEEVQEAMNAEVLLLTQTDNLALKNRGLIDGVSTSEYSLVPPTSMAPPQPPTPGNGLSDGYLQFTTMKELKKQEKPSSKPICSTFDLTAFALQITNGMEFLSDVPCIHRDLAARNVLITERNICKIADFGLAKSSEKNYYRKSEKRADEEEMLPIRWMSPETIERNYYSQASDVWSFGILLYEMFSLGGFPYPHITNEFIAVKIIQGELNRQPEFAYDELYDLMKRCWSFKSEDRPKFKECTEILKSHLLKSSPKHLDQLEWDIVSEWDRLKSYLELRDEVVQIEEHPMPSEYIPPLLPRRLGEMETLL